MTTKRILIVVAALLFGFGAGYFNSDDFKKPKSGHLHSYGRWESSGNTGGITGSKIIMQRKCYVCGALETRLSE